MVLEHHSKLYPEIWGAWLDLVGADASRADKLLHWDARMVRSALQICHAHGVQFPFLNLDDLVQLTGSPVLQLASVSTAPVFDSGYARPWS